MIATNVPPTEPQPSDDIGFDEIRENILQYGVQLIASFQCGGNYRPYVHTIGLHERGQPELIAFADNEDDLDALADLFQKLAKNGHPVESGETLPCRTGTLFAADPEPELDRFLQEHCLGDAKSYYGLDRIDVLVVVCESELSTTDVH